MVGDASATNAELVSVEARVEGRFFVVRPAGAGRHPILVGFHGYGENATRHLAELRRIPGIERWLLAAVEALHPFYDRKSSEVVRSWMTKEGRERAIADNAAFAGTVFARLRELAGGPSPLVLCGFSQGTSMAWRTAALAGERIAAVVALGGDVPPELGERTDLGVRCALLGRGREDTWYTAEKMARDRELLAAHGVAVETREVAGGHEWTDEFRAIAGAYLGPIAAHRE